MEDDALPESVQAEVDKIRQQEGIDEPAAEPAAERIAIPTGPGKPLSRRQAAEQERIEQIRQASDRAERAEKMAEELRKDRERDIEWRARIEANLQHALSRPEPQRQVERETPAVDITAEIQKLRRKRDEALAQGKLDEYEDLGEAIIDIKSEAKAQALIAKLPKHEVQPQKPAWVTAVESQYPDVMMHPNGLQAVAAFAQIDPSQFGPEKLKRAFDRAREEYGSKKTKEPNGQNERRREQLAGGPVNGGARASAKGEKFVNVPSNYREIARRAGMKPEDYIRSYAAMNPGEISKE